LIDKKDRVVKRYPKEYASYGEAVRKLGGYKKYYRWLKDNPIVKIGRNEPCRCGSNRKFKKCCMNK
tara:strand:- start:743 stop:940 length:198 start_codon:yes stop_codon:yes gene_type:complete